MGLLSSLFKPKTGALVRLPSGSFTLDKQGRLLTSTLPQSFPQETMFELGQQVLACFRQARAAHMPLAELLIHYASLKVLARELRGGAIIFLMPAR